MNCRRCYECGFPIVDPVSHDCYLEIKQQIKGGAL